MQINSETFVTQSVTDCLTTHQPAQVVRDNLAVYDGEQSRERPHGRKPQVYICLANMQYSQHVSAVILSERAREGILKVVRRLWPSSQNGYSIRLKWTLILLKRIRGLDDHTAEKLKCTFVLQAATNLTYRNRRKTPPTPSIELNNSWYRTKNSSVKRSSCKKDRRRTMLSISSRKRWFIQQLTRAQ